VVFSSSSACSTSAHNTGICELKGADVGAFQQLGTNWAESMRKVLDALIAEYEAEREWLANYADILSIAFAYDGIGDSMAPTAAWADTDDGNWESAARASRHLGVPV
jgi:hypothetical protein